MFSDRAISITTPRLWNDLPPQFRTISLPPPPTLPITRHHLPLSLLSGTTRSFHSKLKCHFFKHSYPDPSDHSPSLLEYNTIHKGYIKIIQRRLFKRT